eukprot:67345-Pleurochrysis_carterae.AAC.1
MEDLLNVGGRKCETSADGKAAVLEPMLMVKECVFKAQQDDNVRDVQPGGYRCIHTSSLRRGWLLPRRQDGHPFRYQACQLEEIPKRAVLLFQHRCVLERRQARGAR